MSRLAGKELQRRIDQKWSYRYAAKALRTVYKGGTEGQNIAIHNLIGELDRRGKIGQTIKIGIRHREWKKERDEKRKATSDTGYRGLR